MKKYNLEYEANGKRTELKNITMQEAESFIRNLEKEHESSLHLKQINDDEEER